MSEAAVRVATPEDATVVGGLLWDFNTARGALRAAAPARSKNRHRAAAPRAGVVPRAGRRGVHINVDEVDADTRRFYERHGFRNVLPGTDYRMLFYERDL